MALPAKVVGGYWYMEGPSSHPLRDVHTNYNTVWVAFAKGINSTSGTLVLPATAQGDASFRSDIAYLQAIGTRVILSIGGIDDIGGTSHGYTLSTTSQQNQAIASLTSLISSYNLDGIDWDLEAPYNFTVAAMVTVTNALKTTFPNLIVTLAPETFDAINPSGKYRQVATALGTTLSAIMPQYYNHSVTEVYSLADIVDTTRSLSAAYGASRVLIGTMNHDDSHSDTDNTDTNNTTTIATEVAAWNTLIAELPLLRGMYIWTTYYDKVNATNGPWAFATTLGPLINPPPVPEPPPPEEGEPPPEPTAPPVVPIPGVPVYVSGLNATPSARIAIPTLYGFDFPNWEIMVGSNRVGPEYALLNAKNRTLTIRLGEADTATCIVNGSSPEASRFNELEDDMWWYRNGDLLHRGRIDQTNDSGGNVFNVDMHSSSYEALLARRALTTEPFHNYAVFPGWKVDAIIKWLIDHAENQTGMRLGLTYGQWLSLPTFEQIWGKTASEGDVVQVMDGDGILAAVNTVCSMTDPILDFWIDPQLKAHIAQPRGKDQNVVLDFYEGNAGGGTVSDFSRSWSADTYANVIRQTGSNSTGTFVKPYIYSAGGMGKPLTPTHAGGADSALLNKVLPPAPFSADPSGGWQDDRSNDHIYNISGVAAAAKTNWTASSVKKYSYSATLFAGHWRGPQHIWVGDYVMFAAKRGRVDVRERMRVVGLTISIDDNGLETVTVEMNLSRDYEASLRKFRNTIRDLQKKK